MAKDDAYLKSLGLSKEQIEQWRKDKDRLNEEIDEQLGDVYKLIKDESNVWGSMNTDNSFKNLNETLEHIERAMRGRHRIEDLFSFATVQALRLIVLELRDRK